MAKKIPIVVVIALILVTAALTLAATVGVYTKEYNKIIGDLPKRAEQYAALQEADELIRANYYGDFSGSSLDQNIINGLVQSLGDKYCSYLTAGAYKQYLSQQADKKTGTVISSKTGKIGYIRIVGFSDETPEKFREALDSFDAEETDGVILDLRNTGGGDLQTAVKIIDLIVPLATEGNGAIAVTQNAAGETIDIYSADAQSSSFAFCVLINDRTDGPAELVACDLRDFGKATLIGEKTAGHGTIQKPFQMSDGSALLLTVCRIVPYLSESYDGVGVLPDEEVQLSPEDKNALFSAVDEIQDTQLSAAFSALTKE